MVSFDVLTKALYQAHTARQARSALLLWLGWYDADALACEHFWCEHPAFIVQAALSIQQVGE